jgi:hypothetical protein
MLHPLKLDLKIYQPESVRTQTTATSDGHNLPKCIPTRGNRFLPVRLLWWADWRGTVEQADSAARAELQGAPKQKLLQQKNIQKYHWVEHREMLICCLDVCMP